MGRRLRCCAVIVAVVSLTGCWNQFRGGPTRTGNQSDESALGPGQTARFIRAWTATTGGAVDSSPALTRSGTVFVGSNDGKVYAFNATTGAPVWSTTTGGAVSSSVAWAENYNSVFVGSADHKLWALDASTGAQKWTATTGGAITSSPTFAGANVYVGSGDGKVYAFNATTGAPVWSATTGGPVISSPAIGGSTLYVGSNDAKIYALNSANGSVLWSATTGGAVRSTPAVGYGAVLVGSDDGKIHAYNATTGAQQWTVTTGGLVDASVALDGAGTVYAAGEDSVLRALDLATGAQKWTANLGGAAYSSPTVANGAVYLGTRAGTVEAYNTVNGARLFSDQTGGPVLSSPAELNRIVYVGSGDGKLYAYTPAPSCGAGANAIACENSKPGTPQSTWDVSGNGNPTIQGFATDMSVNVGGTVRFKVKTPATAYHADVYRLGYYAGNGARKIGSFSPSVALPQSQPTCLTDPTTNLVDCGNWSESASWTVPAGAVSGIYVAKLIRDDQANAASHVVFVVRDDASHSDLLFQTSDMTWEAYNRYGGAGIYQVGGNGHRAYKASYNRPFDNRGSTFPLTSSNQVFGDSEYPTVRFLEANGYDVSYASGFDTDRFGAHLLNHKAFLSVGHDEYWSRAQRDNVEAARAAGVNLAFFSGNELYWKNRWEPSIDQASTANRTLVVYKEPFDNADSVPVNDPSSIWTGLWRDQRFGPPPDGARPENALSGTSYTDACCDQFSITVSAEEGQLRLWRNTTLAALAPGTSATFGDRVVGYEFDEDLDNGFRPAGEIDLSTTVHTIGGAAPSSQSSATFSADDTLPPAPGTRTTASASASTPRIHHVTFYRTANGALVLGVGTNQWGFGLDSHAGTVAGGTVPDVRIMQATINALADMGAQPSTLVAGLVFANASTDTAAPASTITTPADGVSAAAGSPVTVTGTASDSGGGRVGGVEVSTDGQSWHPAAGRGQWSYTFTPNLAAGPLAIRSRAADDSGNIETPGPGVTITITARTCPCTIFNGTSPAVVDSGAATPIEVGTKFRPDTSGTITALRFYKSSANTGTHVGRIWAADGTLLGSATFTGETASGWQQVSLTSPVPVTANSLYVVSYHTDTGHAADDKWFSTHPSSFYDVTGVDATPLHMVSGAGPDGPNGVFANGASAFPTQPSLAENYWVDVVFVP